jgi:hypothetical protein
MGSRANYAILEDGRVELFYAHWGAATVAEDVFWGPKRTEAFIRSNQPTESWLDNVWAEGGVAFDKDHRHLTYYTYEWPDAEDIWQTYESLLDETWSLAGWTVSRAREWADVAGSVGVDRSLVTTEPSPPSTIAFDELGRNLERSFCCGILSVKTAFGWEDRAIDFVLIGFLMNGPTLLDRLVGVADLETMRSAFERREERSSARVLGDWIDEFCAIDPDKRILRISLPEYERDQLKFVQDAWPGWVVIHEDGGSAGHFSHTGRELPADLVPSLKPPASAPPQRTHDECVLLIQKQLAENETRKSTNAAAHVGLIQQISERSGPVTVAPGFFDRVPSSAPSFMDRIRLALRLRSRRHKTSRAAE